MIKQVLDIIKRYFRPYKAYIGWSIVLNIIAQVLNVFSFVVLIPILNILFKIDQNVYTYKEWTWSTLNKDLIVNNAYAWVQEQIASNGAFLTLCLMGGILVFMTCLKCIGYWSASNIMLPLSTGVVRDIRMDMYNKVMRLPLSFFSAERKGDIIVRMSTDIQIVENSVTSAISAFIQQPIAIIVCFITLFTVSWQLTVFVLIVTPPAAWIMGTVTKKLKSRSAKVQAKLAMIMSQIEETLSGLRIVKAFIAEDKMSKRFNDINNQFRKGMIGMMMRINAAHPVSESMGTIIIVIVLLFGGWLILEGEGFIDASTFIFYMVILYSVINPIKDLTRQSYMIPMGLASMDRIDYILKAENPIKEKENPEPLNSFEQQVELKDVSFYYNEGRDVLKHINLTVPKGKTVALVGQSGSGKSTLVDLIPRYHDVCDGQILIDGKDIRDVRIHDLRTLIGNVNQEAILFNDTF
ncbi:MAG: ABC transporter ATP-binding protein, partial [Bacteroidaceae bacterium]|nr:ABC transporter ATP-binding protein [Bacteroidaceae bacterium]